MTMVCRKKKVEENRWRRRKAAESSSWDYQGPWGSSGLLAGTESWGLGWRKKAGPTVGEGNDKIRPSLEGRQIWSEAASVNELSKK